MHLQDLYYKIFNSRFNEPGAQALMAELVKKYPYFATPAFFLLKITPEGSEDYRKIAARAALHFNNPYLLNYKLQQVDAPDDEEIIHIPDQRDQLATEPLMETNNTEPIEDIIEDKEVVLEQPEVPESSVAGILSKTPVADNEEPMIFEPLFATDYFASQGIKLSEEVQPGDKLGKQLKSFTEWLKSMKRIHEGKLAAVSEQVDLAVQNLAEKSNEEGEVITESMAEAYLQQGKPGKAREIFQKLSLLNPAKSAYFAAKIDQLRLKQ